MTALSGVSGSDQGQINGILVSNHTHRESTRNRTYVKFIGDLCQVFKQVFYLLKLFAGGQFEVGHISNRKIQSKNQKFSLDFQWKFQKIENFQRKSWIFRFFEFFKNFDFLKFPLKIQWKFFRSKIFRKMLAILFLDLEMSLVFSYAPVNVRTKRFS